MQAPGVLAEVRVGAVAGVLTPVGVIVAMYAPVTRCVYVCVCVCVCVCVYPWYSRDSGSTHSYGTISVTV